MSNVEIGDSPLAEIVTWDAPSEGTAWSAVRGALEAAGLDPETAPALSSSQAFVRAIKIWRDRYRVDRVKSSRRRLWQFTRFRDDGEQIHFAPEVQVELDADGEVQCPEAPPIQDELRREMETAAAERTGRDISRVVATIYDTERARYPVVPRKGVCYVVPADYLSLNDKVAKFLEQCGGRLHRFSVHLADDQARRSVCDAIDLGLRAMVAEVTESVDRWNAQTREGTQDAARHELELVAQKADQFADYLQESRAQLEAAMVAARQRIESKAKELRDEFPAV